MRLGKKKGYTCILVCVMLPIIIAIMGLCIDVGLMIYSRAKLMGAVKFAAISASSNNYRSEGQLVIIKDEYFAEEALNKNYDNANLTKFEVNDQKKNECTLEATADIKFVFLKVFGFYGAEITESYTVDRN